MSINIFVQLNEFLCDPIRQPIPTSSNEIVSAQSHLMTCLSLSLLKANLYHEFQHHRWVLHVFWTLFKWNHVILFYAWFLLPNILCVKFIHSNASNRSFLLLAVEYPMIEMYYKSSILSWWNWRCFYLKVIRSGSPVNMFMHVLDWT